MRPITLADANSHSDTNDTITLTTAQAHSDANDTATLTAANAYTDAQMSAISFTELDPVWLAEKVDYYTKSEVDASQVIQDDRITALENANPIDTTGFELQANKGVPDGYAPLDASGVVPTQHLPPMGVPADFDNSTFYTVDYPASGPLDINLSTLLAQNKPVMFQAIGGTFTGDWNNIEINVDVPDGTLVYLDWQHSIYEVTISRSICLTSIRVFNQTGSESLFYQRFDNLAPGGKVGVRNSLLKGWYKVSTTGVVTLLAL